MTTITTVAELEALPIGAVVEDCEGDVWRKLSTGRWTITDEDGTFPDRLAGWKPLTLLLALPATRMTRCCGSDSCVNTTPLPPRSSWLCADHQQHITLGRDS